ncbi:MAG: hypothetical protein AAF985_04890 [Bacteroidota bacterium]
MKFWNRINPKHPALIKLLNWEYWPAKMFYLPLWFYLPYLQIRARHLCFFTAANPGIDTGGLGLESKFDTIEKIPAHLKPKTILVGKADRYEDSLQQLEEAGIDFPLIVKPDVGYRGLLVKKIDDQESFKNYLQRYRIDFIVQEFVQVLNEFGVLYYRLPSDEKGQITSLTFKEFLHVTGDGHSTLSALIKAKPRAQLQLERLSKSHADQLANIPAKGEHVPLGLIGNHSKGTSFINANQHINEALVDTFDQITKQLPGVFYGRYDIKCPSFEDLKAGRNITIIEINGVCAEPTHIYDAQKSSYFGALKDIMKHWKIIYQISKANRKMGTRYMPVSELINRYFQLKTYLKGLDGAEQQEV